MSCAHAACHCADATIERDGRRYCSEHCARQAQSQATGGCGCGHPGCAEQTPR